MDKDAVSLEKLMLQYEASNRAEQKSPQTAIWYQTALGQFLHYLRQQRIEPVLGSVDSELVRQYILHLQTRPKYEDHPISQTNGKLSPVTVQGYVRAMKAFFNWLYREGYTEEFRLARVKVPKVPRKLIEPLSETEVATILASIDHQSAWGVRDATIVLLFLDTGLRRGELAGASMANLHLEEGYLKVMGKGSKERVAPFGGAAQRALMKYIFHFRPEPLGEDGIFLTLDGRPLTGEAVQLMVRRLAKASGVEQLHPHLMRHTFAVNYLMNGEDVFTLQQILGHTTLEMVRRYVNLASSHVMTQQHRFSPVDQMNLRQVRQVTVMRGNVRRRSVNAR